MHDTHKSCFCATTNGARALSPPRFAAAELKKATDKLEEEEDEAKKAALEKQRTKYIQEIKALEARVDASAVKAQAGGLSPAAPAFTPSKTAPPATAADGAAKADASAAAAAPAEPVPEPVTATFGKFKEQWATIGFKKEEIDEFIRGLQVTLARCPLPAFAPLHRMVYGLSQQNQLATHLTSLVGALSVARLSLLFTAST